MCERFRESNSGESYLRSRDEGSLRVLLLNILVGKSVGGVNA